ncbi:MAG: DUF5060 domain-containing protein [Chitinivibrionales bacterium]|nr:DUF5060 domain-containing protein [Chitinivibrionales bacterium]
MSNHMHRCTNAKHGAGDYLCGNRQAAATPEPAPRFHCRERLSDESCPEITASVSIQESGAHPSTSGRKRQVRYHAHSTERSTVVSTRTVTIVLLFLIVAAAAQFSAVFGLDGSLTAPSSPVAAYDVVDFVFSHSQSYANPWEALDMTADFVSPDGDTLTVGGFYYRSNEWRFRFAPTAPGTWTWRVSVERGGDTFTESGELNCSAGDNRGFLAIHTGNPQRFVNADGSAFYPVGVVDCLSLESTMGMDSERHTIDHYLSTFAAAGFNIYRLSLGNCAYVLEADNGITASGNRYNEMTSRNLDEKLGMLHDKGYSIVLCLFNNNNTTAYADSTDNPALMDAVKRYVKYYVDRYGAYVDIWETVNESYAGFGQYSFRGWDRLDSVIVPHIRAADPYDHLVGRELYKIQPAQSRARYDVGMPHVYLGGDNQNQDSLALYQVDGSYNTHSGIEYCRSLNPRPMPILYGEYGNRGTCNWHENSALWHRIRHWVGFMHEAAFISWHTGYSQEYCGTPANIWIGPVERAYTRYLQDFCTDVDPLARPDTLSASDSAVHVHALSSPTMCVAYLYNTGDQSGDIGGVTLAVDPPFVSGSGYWYSPTTGDTLGEFTTTDGPQNLAVPAFTIDIAAKIHTTVTTRHAAPVRSAAIRGTASAALYDLVGRRVSSRRAAQVLLQGTPGMPARAVLTPNVRPR